MPDTVPMPEDAPRDTAPARSHTQSNPVVAPHTKAGLSTISTPEPYIRIFLLAWAVRYIPRGLLGELFDSGTIRPVKEAVNKFIDRRFLARHLAKIETVLSKNHELVALARKDETALEKGGAAQSLYKDMRKVIDRWRGDASEQVPSIIKGLSAGEHGALALDRNSKDVLRKSIRGRLDDMFYSIFLFGGSTALTLTYSRNVRRDIQNLFSEAVAMEKDIPPEKVTFGDIAHSDNQIIRHTVENYRHKRQGRLLSDVSFLGAAYMKSMHITDVLLGWKGFQMFRDTQRRNPTMFEDLITFVNNKINPINGLGQPISVGEVFDLYQHYAQTYAPDRAFVGVIEHAKSEGARWAENQVIFQRMTELLNKTYAYKHASILDPATGLTVLQADFALPKFIYLLGHDLIDVHQPQKTLATLEIANRYGISAVKEMQAMLKAGQPLAAALARYSVTLPAQEMGKVATADGNAVRHKGSMLQKDGSETPHSTIEGHSVEHAQPLMPNGAELAV